MVLPADIRGRRSVSEIVVNSRVSPTPLLVVALNRTDEFGALVNDTCLVELEFFHGGFRYVLSSFVAHTGLKAVSGHYFACVRVAKGQAYSWFCVDDATVTPCDVSALGCGVGSHSVPTGRRTHKVSMVIYQRDDPVSCTVASPCAAVTPSIPYPTVVPVLDESVVDWASSFVLSCDPTIQHECLRLLLEALFNYIGHSEIKDAYQQFADLTAARRGTRPTIAPIPQQILDVVHSAGAPPATVSLFSAQNFDKALRGTLHVYIRALIAGNAYGQCAMVDSRKSIFGLTNALRFIVSVVPRAALAVVEFLLCPYGGNSESIVEFSDDTWATDIIAAISRAFAFPTGTAAKSTDDIAIRNPGPQSGDVHSAATFDKSVPELDSHLVVSSDVSNAELGTMTSSLSQARSVSCASQPSGHSAFRVLARDSNTVQRFVALANRNNVGGCESARVSPSTLASDIQTIRNQVTHVIVDSNSVDGRHVLKEVTPSVLVAVFAGIPIVSLDWALDSTATDSVIHEDQYVIDPRAYHVPLHNISLEPVVPLNVSLCLIYDIELR